LFGDVTSVTEVRPYYFTPVYQRRRRRRRRRFLLNVSTELSLLEKPIVIQLVCNFSAFY
jgi:hypothetical protein